jgi:membrane protein YdbS with pleckstrin-like domain
MNEEIFYDGPVSWWARTGEIASSIFMAAVFVLAAILIAVWLETWRPWPTVVLAVAAMVPPLLVYLRHINTRYKLTSYRVDFERGIIGRRIDSIELWHIDDICFRQPLLQRIAGVGTLELRSDDRSNPTLVIPALPEGRRLYETLKSRIIAAKRERGLLEVDQ